MAPFLDLIWYRYLQVSLCVCLCLTLYLLSGFNTATVAVPLVFLAIELLQSYRTRKIDAKMKSVLITGCDTGFGNALARCLDRKGMRVFATCLSESSEGARHLRETGSERMCVVQMDVTSDESVATCLEKVQRLCQNEGLWALVNNAGIMYKGDVEIQSMANYKRVTEVNLFGMIRVCKAFLPLIRKKRGRVVNVTSVHGLKARFRDSAYGMSKYGAEGFTDSLRLEMRRFGVKVVLVEPGEYGSATALFSQENEERYKMMITKLISEASKEVKETYGHRYLETLLKPVHGSEGSANQMQPVLDALENAILCVHPNTRYLVDGMKRIDKMCMMARLFQICPAFITDYLDMILWPLPHSETNSS